MKAAAELDASRPEIRATRVGTAGESPVPFPLEPAPSSNPGFRERCRAVIAKPAGGEWTFRVDDEPLGSDRIDGESVWVWEPGFFSGEVTAELVGSDGRVHATYLLDVSPDPGKLGRERFEDMVDEIRSEAPELLFGTEPATAGAGVEGEVSNPHVAFARLRRYGDDFVRGLHAISANPIRELRRRRERRPLHLVRRVDRRTIASALRDREVAGALFATGARSAESVAAPQALTLDVPRVEDHLDGAANRCITRTALSVFRRIRVVRRDLGRLVERERSSETTTDIGSRWPVRAAMLDGLEIRLRQALRRRPFRDVTRPEITAAGLNAVSAHPVYSRAFGLGWRALRPGVAGDPSTERLWISPTWEVFERWCFVRLARELRATHPNLEWKRRDAAHGRGTASWEGTGDGKKIGLILQPEFTGGANWRQGFRSISLTRYPDLLLTEEHGDRRRFVVLDAKYSVSRDAVLKQMASAHIYHDALRWDGLRPDLALLLVPRGGGAEWLESDEFRGEHRVGVVAMGEDGHDSLQGLLEFPDRE